MCKVPISSERSDSGGRTSSGKELRFRKAEELSEVGTLCRLPLGVSCPDWVSRMRL